MNAVCHTIVTAGDRQGEIPMSRKIYAWKDVKLEAKNIASGTLPAPCVQETQSAWPSDEQICG